MSEQLTDNPALRAHDTTDDGNYTETFNRPEHPEHFSEVHHENGEALMCMSSAGECRVLVEVMPGYSPEEEQQLIASTTGALEAIDRFTGGRATDIFTGLHIKIGEDVAGGGAKAVAEENQVLLNGRKMLLSVAEMKQVSGSYSADELAGFPDEQRSGGALEYTLVHEIGHVLDGQTKTGEAYHRVAASESPTRYGREADEWHSDNKDHEAFSEGFAHAVYGMPITETMEATVRQTIEARAQEILASAQNLDTEQISVAETANYQGNWFNLQLQRMQSPDFREKFTRFISNHINSLEPGVTRSVLDKPENFQTHYQAQLDQFDDNLTRVYSAVGYGKAQDVSGKSQGSLGHGKIGKTGTIYSDAANQAGNQLTDRQKDIIAGHEAYHGMVDVKGSAVTEVRSGFDWDIYNQLVDENSVNQPNYLRNPDELLARMAQFKNYFGFQSGEEFTSSHLAHLRQQYIKDIGLDNGISTMLMMIKPKVEPQFIKLMNELPV